MFGISKSREIYFWLVIGIVIPTLGRTIFNFLKKWIWKKITKYLCGGDPCKECFQPSGNHYLQVEDQVEPIVKSYPDAVDVNWVFGDDVVPPKFRSITDPEIKRWLEEKPRSWENARKLLGWSWNLAFCSSFLRLIFWHLMQPIAYCWTVYSYLDQIDPLQRILALIVGAREISYFVLSVYICLSSLSFDKCGCWMGK